MNWLALDRSPSRQAPLAHFRLALGQSSQREYAEDGFLRVRRMILSEATINFYVTEEVPDWQSLGLQPGQQWPFLRDPDELQKSVPTMNSLPLLLGHRPLSSNDLLHELTVGCTGSDAAFDGRYLWNSLMIWSALAIDAVESGEASDISMAYRWIPVIQPASGRDAASPVA